MTELVNLSDTTVIKAGNAFCIALRDGRLPLVADHPLGVYLSDCRHLRGYELRVGGSQPRLLISSDAPGTAAVFEFTNPELSLADGRELALQSLRIRCERRMLASAMAERIVVRSHAREPVSVELELALDADFAPMLEVRGLVTHARRASGGRRARTRCGSRQQDLTASSARPRSAARERVRTTTDGFAPRSSWRRGETSRLTFTSNSCSWRWPSPPP